jgi:Cu-Zn family superoxide dismutase
MRSREFSCYGVAAALAACGVLACDFAPSDARRSALAVVEPTRGHDAEGTIRFESLEEGGVRIVADFRGLQPGRHAFHVHETGDCGEEAAAAGPHYDFLGDGAAEDGAPADRRITGNLGELPVGPEGDAHVEATIGTARLDGPRSIVGRAVVVHARGNDLNAPPDGSAGERIACGVIEGADDDVVARR